MEELVKEDFLGRMKERSLSLALSQENTNTPHEIIVLISARGNTLPEVNSNNKKGVETIKMIDSEVLEVHNILHWCNMLEIIHLSKQSEPLVGAYLTQVGDSHTGQRKVRGNGFAVCSLMGMIQYLLYVWRRVL